MSHLNVAQPSNMNHEYLYQEVGRHSLLEYITALPGDHFVHLSQMYHISTAERETWLHVSCDVSIITIHEIQTLMAGPLIWTISHWGEIYGGVKGDHTIKGPGKKIEGGLRWDYRLEQEHSNRKKLLEFLHFQVKQLILLAFALSGQLCKPFHQD